MTAVLEYFLTEEINQTVRILGVAGLPPEADEWGPEDRWRAVVFCSLETAAQRLKMDKDAYFKQMQPIFGQTVREGPLFKAMVAVWECVNADDEEPDFAQMMDGDSEHRIQIREH